MSGSELQLSIKIDFTDGSLFGNDAGEDEQPDILNSYFVDQPAFNPFLDKGNNFQVARSRKGMGKSALLSKLSYDLERNASHALVIKITGANLIGLAEPPVGASHLQLQNYWYKVILTRINYAVLAHFGFKFSDAVMAVVDHSDLASLAGLSLASSLMNRVRQRKLPIEAISDTVGGHTSNFEEGLAASASYTVWLLVDDIDSTYIDSEQQRALTSTFFSACRAIVREQKGLCIRASVRTDVWSSLRSNEDLDKCEQYVVDIHWAAADLNVILSKKIYSFIQRQDPQAALLRDLNYRSDATRILEFVFVSRIRWGSSMVPPFRPVYILSAGRPRWMSQLCRLAGAQASRQQKERIGTVELNNVMKAYSKFRLNDIYKEHSHQYVNLEKLIETFSNSPARYSTADLLTQLMTNYVNRVGAGNIPNLDGYPYKYPLQLAHFLYKIGFIVGRRETRGAINAEFVRYEERQELLADGKNPDDGMLWEVHPSYREALSIGKTQRAASGAERARSAARVAKAQGMDREPVSQQLSNQAAINNRNHRRGRRR